MPQPTGYVECLVCKGGRGLPAMRWMCATCHKDAKRMITEGQTTWLELEALGLAAPAGGVKKENTFADVLKRKREE